MNLTDESSYVTSNPVISYSQKQKKKKRATRGTLTIAIVIMLILVGFFVAFSAGFIPINAFLEIKEPIGNSSEVDVEYFKEYFPKFSNLDVLEKFKYGVFLTDESSSVIKADYERRLEAEGYSLQHVKTEKIMGLSVKSYGYAKGFTGVGIIIFSNKNFLFDDNSLVVYTTGNVFDYLGVINEYGGISGILS